MIKTLLLAFFFTITVQAEEPPSVVTTATASAPQAAAPRPKKKRKKKSTSGATTSASSAPTTSNVQPADAVEKIWEANKAVQTISKKNDRCALCELNQKTETSGVSETRADELIKMKKQFDSPELNKDNALVEPKTDVNTLGNKSAVCGSRPGNYEMCILNGEVTPSQFKLKTMKPLNREWSFEYPGQATQDMGIMVSDFNDEAFSKSQFTYLMVFPRRYLPSIRTEGNKQIVTLPTGETVTYDTQTKKILSGALSDSLSNDKAYIGEYVSIKVNRNGEEPRLGKGMATITKPGKDGKKKQECKVSLKELWPDQSENSALHFKYPTDKAFDEFLQKRCKFGVY